MSHPFSNESTITHAPPENEETGGDSGVVDDPDPDDLLNEEPDSDADAPERLEPHEYLFSATLAAGKLPNQSMVRYADGGWEYDEDNPAPFDEAPDWMDPLPFDVITTAGHEHMRIAYEYGFKTGGRLDNIDRLAEDGIPIHFIDMDWHNPEFDRLVEAAKKYEAEYIVGGDYSIHDPSHPDSNIELINERAEILSQYSENVIVVPHGSNQVDEVPEWAVVGYSVPTTYGAAEGELIDYHGRDMHLLGGAPAKQMRMIQEFGDDIVSIDGNAINKMANVANRYWSGHDWKFDNPTLDVSNEDKDSDLYQSAAFPKSREIAGSHLVDPDIVQNRNFEAYERSVLHWALQIRTRWENGWFDGDTNDVLGF